MTIDGKPRLSDSSGTETSLLSKCPGPNDQGFVGGLLRFMAGRAQQNGRDHSLAPGTPTNVVCDRNEAMHQPIVQALKLRLRARARPSSTLLQCASLGTKSQISSFRER
jgi:hypothetical protein